MRIKTVATPRATWHTRLTDKDKRNTVAFIFFFSIPDDSSSTEQWKKKKIIKKNLLRMILRKRPRHFPLVVQLPFSVFCYRSQHSPCSLFNLSVKKQKKCNEEEVPPALRPYSFHGIKRNETLIIYLGFCFFLNIFLRLCDSLSNIWVIYAVKAVLVHTRKVKCICLVPWEFSLCPYGTWSET